MFLILDKIIDGTNTSNSSSLSTTGAPSALEKVGRQNSLLRMMERFDGQQITPKDQDDHLNRLHEEILLFRESVRDILHEMQPIKEQLIQNIT
jgi:archaellum component FlaC